MRVSRIPKFIPLNNSHLYHCSLDAESEELMMSIVKKEFSGATVLSVAHRLNTVVGFDKVLVLERGKLIEQGNPEELLAHASAFKKLYESSCTPENTANQM